MKKLITAVALAIALPAAAMAQTAAPANPHAGHDMAAGSGQARHDCMAMNHAGMDHGKMAANHGGMDHGKMNMSGMNMAGMEHCTAKPADGAGAAKQSPAPRR